MSTKIKICALCIVIAVVAVLNLFSADQIIAAFDIGKYAVPAVFLLFIIAKYGGGISFPTFGDSDERALKRAEIRKAEGQAAKEWSQAMLIRAKAEEVMNKAHLQIVTAKTALVINHKTNQQYQYAAPGPESQQEQSGQATNEKKEPLTIRKKMDINEIIESVRNCPTILEAFARILEHTRMLITGGSGGGKSVVMIMLMMLLYKKIPNTKYIFITPKHKRELFFPPWMNVEVYGCGENVYECKDILLKIKEIGTKRKDYEQGELDAAPNIVVCIDEVGKWIDLFKDNFGTDQHGKSFLPYWKDISRYGRSNKIFIWLINQSDRANELELDGCYDILNNLTDRFQLVYVKMFDCRYAVYQPGAEAYKMLYAPVSPDEAMQFGINVSFDPPRYIGGGDFYGWSQESQGHMHSFDSEMGVNRGCDPCDPCDSDNGFIQIPMEYIPGHPYKEDPMVMDAFRRGAESLREICEKIGISIKGGNTKKVQRSLGRYGIKAKTINHNTTIFTQNGRRDYERGKR